MLFERYTTMAKTRCRKSLIMMRFVYIQQLLSNRASTSLALIQGRKYTNMILGVPCYKYILYGPQGLMLIIKAPYPKPQTRGGTANLISSAVSDDHAQVVSAERHYIRIYRVTHRLRCSSFLGLPYRILNRNHTKELPWSLWVHAIPPTWPQIRS